MLQNLLHLDCYCEYNGLKYENGQIIYNTTDGNGSCITAKCEKHGNITRDITPCDTTTTTAPTTVFIFTTTSK